jgi:hypothetical protein
VKWSDVQSTIRRIDQRLLGWVGKLPDKFNINLDTFSPPDWSDPYFLPRTGLAMFYTSSRMLLFRPCLCRFDLRLKSQTEESRDFNQDAVENCILSARRMISLLCWSAMTVDQLYTIRPWWSIIHNLCEALSVLILEMAFRSQHMPDDSNQILEDAKRGVNWLSLMSAQSISARKAWEVFDKLIRLVTPMGNYTVFDLPLEAPIPPGYNWHRLSRSHPDLLRTNQPNPLSQANLQQYQHGQARHSASDATATWTSQPSSHQSFGQPGGFEQSFSSQEFGNPLDHSEALNRFSSLGNIHGLYDEPWEHMFSPMDPQTDVPIFGNQPFDTSPVNQIFNPGESFSQGAAATFTQFGRLSTGAAFVPVAEPEMMDDTPTGQAQQPFDPSAGVGGSRYRF